MRSFMLWEVAQLLLPVTVLFSLHLLIRGHDNPGGGFSAGLVTSLAMVIQALTFGFDWTRSRLGRLVRPALWLGLMVAALTATAPVLFGDPFFTHRQFDLTVAGTKVPLGTTLLFDLGVYAAVVGTTVIALDALARGDRR